MQTTAPSTTAAVQRVALESDQLDGLAHLLSFQAGLVAFLILLVGGLVIIEVHRG